ncbi:MAG TPA: hypothetical protein VFJ94_05135 [Intrasporangium sp.]|uniref:hypothetical protein n=1 Tax=Intrasporangium sp. TaxID=1925024 RepID=UPI002D77CA71|nr:hypothetical protein [Intrasporangium sp.]HET7397887.1 hypothetical protein [Intrasporangium sp.]
MTEQRPRIPDFKRFLLTGAVLGFLAGATISAVRDNPPNYSTGTVLAYLGVVGAVVGTGIAGVVAVLLDRSRRSPD